MSVLTNTVTKFKQLFYNAGANSSVVDTAVDDLLVELVTVPIAGTSTVTEPVAVPYDCKLVAAYFNNKDVAITSADANTKTFQIETNGVNAVSQDSDAFAASLAANTALALTVNSANSFVDAGETILITVTHQAGPAVNGTFTLALQKL